MNQSGIVVKVEGNKRIAILTGDHHYIQLYDAIFNKVNNNKPYEFVVPHHGGNAGNFSKNLWEGISFSGGALSTKEGRYKNIPRADIYKTFVKRLTFHCTDNLGTDYIVNL